MKNKLEGKSFIITGASKGLGEVIAKSFSKYNMKLALIERDKKELKRVKKLCNKTSKCKIFPIDLLEIENIENKLKKVIQYLGDVDGIIHVAGGGYGFRDPLLDANRFSKLINLNLLSIVEINRILLPSMIKNKKGNIVHVGSVAGTDAIGSVAYNTSKAALNAYVRSLGNEMAKYNVIAAGILPGAFLAPNNAMKRLQDNNPDAYNQFISHRLPRKKMGEALELLPIIKILSTNDASMLGGSMISIDAGEGKSYERI